MYASVTRGAGSRVLEHLALLMRDELRLTPHFRAARFRPLPAVSGPDCRVAERRMERDRFRLTRYWSAIAL